MVKKILSIITALSICMGLIGFNPALASNGSKISSFSNDRFTVDSDGREYIQLGSWDSIDKYGYKDGNKELLEWEILEKSNDGKMALVISKYVVDKLPYHDTKIEKEKNITWNECTLRKWLNSEFYDSAFSDDEKRCIKETKIKNEDNVDWDGNVIKGGNDTLDNLFLISLSEARKFFAYGDNSKNIGTTMDGGTALWLLRTPGQMNNQIAYVSATVSQDYIGAEVIEYGVPAEMSYYVRPAFWIDMDAAGLLSNKVIKNDIKVNTDWDKVKKGDTVYIGQYEQDDDITNGIEPIEWTVMSITGNKAMLLSKNAIDCIPYNNSNYTKTNWKDCSLRKWLNDDFYNMAFDKDEKKRIVKSTLKNEDNPKYGTEGGDETADYIFVLSLSDAINGDYGFKDNYNRTSGVYDKDEGRVCNFTDYAKARAYESHSSLVKENNKVIGAWWLRTPGFSSEYVCLVGNNGSIEDTFAELQNVGVRPVMWVSIGNDDDIKVVKPSKPTIKAKASGNNVKITVNKTKNADGFEVYMKSSSEKKYTLVAKIEKNGKAKRTTTLKNLSAGKYSIKVRAYCGATKGSYSKVKKITIKGYSSKDTEKENNLSTSKYKVGDVIQFGKYMSKAIDPTTFDGSEDIDKPIEWIVLSVEDEKLLLISKYILFETFYDSNAPTAYTWEQSTIRKNLNDSFYNYAFSDKEKAMIISTHLNEGKGTNDYVFLLSADDLVNPQYGFNSDKKTSDISRRCSATEFVKSMSLVTGDLDYTKDDEVAYSWWLRSTEGKVCWVTSHGTLFTDDIKNTLNGVRPVINVSTNSLEKLLKG